MTTGAIPGAPEKPTPGPTEPPRAGGNDRAAGFLSAIRGHFAAQPDEICCRFIQGADVEELRWRDVERSARSFLAAYRALEVAPGDPILIFLRHVPQLYGSFLGAMLGGFVPSFMPCSSPKQDPALYWSSHTALLDRVRPAAIVADRATLAEMRANGLDLGRTRSLEIESVGTAQAEWAPAGPESTGLLQHSSGTTGLKKGVALSHRAIAAQLESYAAALAAGERDVVVSWLPLYHDMGLVACFLLPLYLGIPAVQLDAFEWVARPGRLLEHITRWGGTLCWLPNFAFDHLAAMAGRDAARYRLGSMRAFINCSETCKPESFDRFVAAFAVSGATEAQLQCCYAMAEMVFAVTQTRLGAPVRRLRVDRSSLERGAATRLAGGNEPARELVEVGAPIAGVSLSVVDQERRELPEGRVGEIAIGGAFLFSGYHEDPERTRERIAGGTYFTRDLGFARDGAVYVLGRIDDLIIVNGRNIYAHEIEQLLNEVAGLKRGRAVALPWPDERAGTQSLVVVAERAAGAARDDAELRAEILKRVFSVTSVTAKSVHLVEEGWLVKTTSGKISRERNLRKLAETLSAT